MIDAAQDGTKKIEGTQPDVPAVLSVSDVAAKLSTAADDQAVRTLIDKDPALAGRLLSMSDEELAELDRHRKELPQPGSQPVQPAPEASDQSGTPVPPTAATAPETASQEDIVIKLKPSELGTYYSKGRSGQEAITELIKGKRSADDRIKFLNEDRLPAVERTAKTFADQANALRTENESLKKQLEGFKTAKPADGAAAPAAADPAKGTEFKPVTIPDEIDFYDPDQQKGVIGMLRQFQENQNALITELKSLKQGKPAPAASAPAAPSAQDTAPSAPAPQGPSPEVVAELDAIRMVQRNPEHEGLFATKTDVADVERQYIDFVSKLGKLCGMQSIFDANGAYTAEAARVANVYFDPTSPDYQALKTAADAQGINPPEDLPALNRLYEIRKIRGQYHSRDPITGVLGPIPYEEAIRVARSMKPEIFTSSTKPNQQSDRAALESAKQVRSAFAPDPAGTSSADVGMAQHSFDEYMRLMKKDRDSYTPEEVERLGKMLIKYAEFSEQEVINWFKKPGG